MTSRAKPIAVRLMFVLVPVMLFCAGEVWLRVYQLVRAGVPML